MINWSTTDIAGIEFGDRHIAAVRVRGKGKGSFILTHAGYVDCDLNAPPAMISDAVKTLWKQTRMPTRTVCASLQSASLAMRYFSLPALTEDELKRTLLLKAEEALQMPAKEIVVEWCRNEISPKGGGGGPVTGILIAAPARDVERELGVLNDAGLDPVILDIRALAVANLYQLMGREPGGMTECVVYLCPHSADVIIRRGDGEMYPHTISCHASTWAESPGFLSENIRDVLRYAEYKLGWDHVQEIVMMGTIPGEEMFLATLKAGLGVEVKCWDPVAGIGRHSRAVESLLSDNVALAGVLAPALGLALRRS